MRQPFQINPSRPGNKNCFHNNNIRLITYFHASLQRQKQVLPIFWKQNHFIVFFCSFLHVAETMQWIEWIFISRSNQQFIHPLKGMSKSFLPRVETLLQQPFDNWISIQTIHPKNECQFFSAKNRIIVLLFSYIDSPLTTALPLLCAIHVITWLNEQKCQQRGR